MSSLTKWNFNRLKICNDSEIALHSSKGVSGKIVAVSGKERFGFYDTTVLYYIEVCVSLEMYVCMFTFNELAIGWM